MILFLAPEVVWGLFGFGVFVFGWVQVARMLIYEMDRYVGVLNRRAKNLGSSRRGDPPFGCRGHCLERCSTRRPPLGLLH